jgi:hypothetical protein
MIYLTTMTPIAELQYFSTIPKLKVNGFNWIIFQIHLKWALEEKEAFGHLDGSTTNPDETVTAKVKTEWLKNETKACHFVA